MIKEKVLARGEFFSSFCVVLGVEAT